MSTLPPQVLLSYSRNDLPAASQLRATLMQKGLAVFKDDDSIRRGDEWVWRLQEGIQACSVFLILVGRDGLREWMRLESGSAIARRTSASSLCPAIVPVLLDDTGPEALPLFLAGFQCTRWRQADLVPEQLIDEIRAIKPDTQLIVLTGDSEKCALLSSAGNGIAISHYILKPVSFEMLFAALDHCFGEITER